MLHERDGTSHPLLPEELDRLYAAREIEFPAVPAAEIEDKSKGDAISKGLVILQTSWFTIQCVARGIRHLPLTGLELATLAFTVLNFFTYLVWWKKPQDVNCPIAVYRKAKLFPLQKTDLYDEHSNEWRQHAGDSSKLENDDTHEDFIPLLPHLPFTYHPQLFTKLLTASRNKAQTVQDKLPKSTYDWRTAGLWCLTIIPRMVMSFANDSHRSLRDMILTPDIDYQSRKRVPTFYAVKAGRAPWLVGASGILIGTVFGAIHCIGWSFQFPSHKDKLLWRVSSVDITLVPIWAILFSACTSSFEILTNYKRGSSVVYMFVIMGIIGNALLLFLSLFVLGGYIPSRITLLVLPFTTLRDLPPGVYKTVQYLDFIPHL